MPGYEERKAAYDKAQGLFEDCRMAVCEGGVWGTGDIFVIGGVETMLMYFSTEETVNYIDDILNGKHLDSVRGFYPIGRCATLKNINIVYDESGILGSFKEKLSIYPEKLREEMVNFHRTKTDDEEDFGRALLRKDVLFYHQVLEAAIDHYLQAVFALNRTYFPSRKRTKQYIDSFEMKPVSCYDRLLEVIRFGSDPETLEKSYTQWRTLVSDLKALL